MIKNKIKNSITSKVFLFTTIPIFLLVLFLILSQVFFFNDFYVTEKNKKFENDFLVLKEYLDNYNYTTRTVQTKIYTFQESTNSKVAILNNSGSVILSTNVYNDNLYTEVTIMNKAISHWLNSDSYTDVLFGDTVSNFQFTDPSSKTVYTVMSASLKTRTPSILFAITTLQPVDEANSILTKYYLYFLIAALLILVFVSTALSRMLTKPLIQINDSAKKMSDLDFSEKCDVDSEDELGSLGNSLNLMSNKLNLTLTELKKANKKLQSDIEKERELEKMRREFIGDISHELKTPLSIVKGYAEALQDGVVDEDDVNFYTETIIEEAENLNSLVLDMLNLSKLENDPYSILLEDENVKTLLQSLSKKYSLLLKEHNFILELDPNIYSAYANFDSTRISEVIHNFITNAQRHTPKGGIIKLSLSSVTPTTFKVSVFNEGNNISPTDLENIWSKFYRVDKSRNKSSGGSGLGLAISKRILDLHNFQYGVKNHPSGVEFFIIIK